jgi:hypothetical protein
MSRSLFVWEKMLNSLLLTNSADDLAAASEAADFHPHFDWRAISFKIGAPATDC